MALLNETIGKCECIHEGHKNVLIDVLDKDIRSTEEYLQETKKRIKERAGQRVLTDYEAYGGPISTAAYAIGILKETRNVVEKTPKCK